MELPRYELSAEDSLKLFEFISEGPKGKVSKLVNYKPTNLAGVYNLAFGDRNPETGNLNDTSVSNNGDREKILATVVDTVYLFTGKYPENWVYASGSTNARTRLYRMGITKYLNIIQKDFEIYGLRNNVWECFEKDKEYEAFVARRKRRKFNHGF